jgi:hypothetical protein
MGFNPGGLVNWNAIVAEEMVREFSTPRDRGRRPPPGLGCLERFRAQGEDLYFEAAGLPGHECHLGTLQIDPSGRIQVRCSARSLCLRWESLADPRCFARLRVSIEVGVDRWIATLYREFESTRDSFLIQRLTALKAFYLAFEATRSGRREELAADLAEIIELLEIEDPEEPATIRRQALYRLALAGCRLHEPDLVRQAARFGPHFRQFGSFSPIFPWRKIVDAVCRAARERGMHERRRQRPRLPLARTEEECESLRRAAESAVDVSKDVLERLGLMLRHGTLRDLARLHRIY